MRFRRKLAISALLSSIVSCGPLEPVSTIQGGATFSDQDCRLSPIGGAPFQTCTVSSWVIGSGHATSGGFTARPPGTGVVPGTEGGPIDSEKIFTAAMTGEAARITVQYAIPHSPDGAFDDLAPLATSDRIDPDCTDIRVGACRGVPITMIATTEIPYAGRRARVEQFTLEGDPRYRAGFVADLRGPDQPGRPGYRSSAVVRGFFRDPAANRLDAIEARLATLTFR
jgi:hypothetical protein